MFLFSNSKVLWYLFIIKKITFAILNNFSPFQNRFTGKFWLDFQQHVYVHFYRCCGVISDTLSDDWSVLKPVCSSTTVSWFYTSLNNDYNTIDCEEKLFSFSKNDRTAICTFLSERNGKLYIIQNSSNYAKI